MARCVAALAALLLLLTLSLASAAELNVNGGALQAFEMTVRFPTAARTPTPTTTASPTVTAPAPGQAGTSLEASVTALAEAGLPGRYVVGGQVCVHNRGDRLTENLLVALVIQTKRPGDPFADLPDTALTLPPPTPLAPGAGACYAYALSLAADGGPYRVAARVTITNHSGWLPGGPHCPGPEACPFGPETRADFELADAPDAQRALMTPTVSPTGTEPALALPPTATEPPAATETASPTASPPDDSTALATLPANDAP